MNIQKTICAGVTVCGLCIGTTVAQHPVDSNYVFSQYTERVQYFQSLPRTKKAIVFLGNSLTEAGRWSDILPGRPVINRGISGDISYGVIARLDEVLSHKPAKIFLMIGVNDLKRDVPPGYIIENYKRMVARIRKDSPKTVIYLNSVLPVNPDILIEPFKAVKNEDISVLNAALKVIASENKKTIFVDLNPVVADERGYLRNEITPDGIHLEVAAYVPLVAYLKQIKAL
ncbi:GDSL-type esterase/lipase family protein [Parapedobacter deserti]|uniref:GDSL-type esterase/lipase family protein n=1 Tax=Parapedobacter deserti TaxID=1912957 RepID=A0ABV7JG73_9SPHI